MKTLFFTLSIFLSVQSLICRDLIPQNTLSAADSIRRLSLDFCKTETEVLEELSRYELHNDPEQIKAWENEFKLEMRIINGEKRYFRNSVSNLFRLDAKAYKQRDLLFGKDLSEDVWTRVPRETVLEIINAKNTEGDLFAPRDFQLQFNIKIPFQNILKDDSIVRCWMPAPHTGVDRQKNVRISSVQVPDSFLYSDLSHASLYFEKEVIGQNSDVLFGAEYSFSSYARHYSLPFLYNNEKMQDKLSDEYLYYTREQEKHIVFTSEIKALAGDLIDSTSNVQTIKNIFDYISDNIPWCSAIEYCNIDNIPMYVLKNRHGDCGQVSLLFITLCRYCGIPAKWQSGWMLHPNAENLHDWSEVYINGVGWIPVDVSFGRILHHDPNVEYFYLGGIDPYRLVINQDFSQKFKPEKQFYRSEPVDFQRGEVETNNRNLYFDQWQYKLLKK